MDSTEKDESRARLREEALARRMGEALDRISAAGAGDCPDAEVIAAYHERALQPEEIAQWEGHFAGCSRCRKILAVLAASIDAPLVETEVARLGELVAATRPASAAAPHKAKLIESHQFDWRARWLAPALGVAAVLAIWLAIRPPWRAPAQGPSGTLVAQAPKSDAPLEREKDLQSSNPISGMESKKAREAPAAVSNNVPPAKTSAANPPPEPPETNRMAESKSLDELKAKAPAPETRSSNEKEAASEVAGAASGAPSTVAARPPAAAVPQLQAANGEAPGPAGGAGAMSNAPARDEQVVGGIAGVGVARAARPAPEIPVNGRSMQAFSLAQGAAKVGELMIPSPLGKIIWRVGAGGKIERSADAGRTWIIQASPSSQDWLAGAATSDTVCWLVGRNGSIVRTTDGEHWTEIISPVAARGAPGQFPDWTSVTANSALVAIVTSSANQRYGTVDGGITWKLE